MPKMLQKHDNIFLIVEKSKRHNALKHRGKKWSCCYCLQSFGTVEVLKHHIKDWSKS